MSTPAMRATFDLLSTLPLLVAGVLADHPHHAVAPDDLALVAHRLDAGTDLHRASFCERGHPRPHAAPAASARLDCRTGSGRWSIALPIPAESGRDHRMAGGQA